jgi:hypothetical protein
MKREAKLYIIGETYIKFDFEYSDLSKSLIKKAYLEQVGLKSRDFLKAKELIKVSIEYDKGSTKTRIIIWGTVVNIYLGIGKYGDFKSGIREIINDVKSFSTYVIDHIDDDPNINQNDILNTQRRTGLPGRINELYKQIESLEQNLNDLSNNEVQIELQEIKGEIANISEVLSGQERNSFLQSINNNYKQNLPQPDNRKTTYIYNRYALKPEDDIEIIEE